MAKKKPFCKLGLTNWSAQTAWIWAHFVPFRKPGLLVLGWMGHEVCAPGVQRGTGLSLVSLAWGNRDPPQGQVSLAFLHLQNDTACIFLLILRFLWVLSVKCIRISRRRTLADFQSSFIQRLATIARLMMGGVGGCIEWSGAETSSQHGLLVTMQLPLKPKHCVFHSDDLEQQKDNREKVCYRNKA